MRLLLIACAFESRHAAWWTRRVPTFNTPPKSFRSTKYIFHPILEPGYRYILGANPNDNGKSRQGSYYHSGQSEFCPCE
jgi:hypothetical protein